jgi:hypothetical protein
MSSKTSSHHALWWKIPLALLLVGALVAWAGRQLFPTASVSIVLLVFAAGSALLLLAAALWAAVGSAMHQRVLNRGGKDPDWFWFRADPPGLQALRGEDK